jgi:plastocyanin
MPVHRSVLVAMAAAIGVSGAPAGAAPPPVPSVVVAGPGAFAAGFATPTVLTLEGQPLQFASADVAPHNVRSRATVLKRVKVGRTYKTVRVRLFSSSTIDGAGVAEVVGVSALKPGSYAFICSVHPNMVGQLQVQPSPV